MLISSMRTSHISSAVISCKYNEIIPASYGTAASGLKKVDGAESQFSDIILTKSSCKFSTEKTMGFPNFNALNLPPPPCSTPLIRYLS